MAPRPPSLAAPFLLLALAVLLSGCTAPCSRLDWRCLDACGPADAAEASDVEGAATRALEPGRGAAPGDERGPGGFVPRRDARSFYSAGGGRLWYYLNHYYWAPSGVPTKDLWIRAEVVEEFRGLRRWPDGRPVDGPPPKVTREYWAVGASGRTVTIDNHKDFWLLRDAYCAGEIHVAVTLELGRLSVRDAGGAWGAPSAPYVLEERSFGDGRGIGREAARFEPHPRQPTTAWEYRVPWASCPARMTRSSWAELEVPAWVRVDRPLPARPPAPRPPVTTGD